MIVLVHAFQALLVFLGAGIVWIQAGEWSKELDNQRRYGASSAVTFSAGISTGLVAGAALIYWLTGQTLFS